MEGNEQPEQEDADPGVQGSRASRDPTPVAVRSPSPAPTMFSPSSGPVMSGGVGLDARNSQARKQTGQALSPTGEGEGKGEGCLRESDDRDGGEKKHVDLQALFN